MWENIKELIPPVIDIAPFVIEECQLTKDMSPYVWEYPVATELAQYKLHKKIPIGQNFDVVNNIVNTYLGIPWGRFDAVKMLYPYELVQFLKYKIKDLKSIAKNNNYELKIHTTTHRENWWLYIPLFEEIGITNVHSAHYDKPYVANFNPFKRKTVIHHCLALDATNVEQVGRNIGLEYTPLKDKKYLATFKGAHMPHYKSDVRILLKSAYEQLKDKTDIYVEVTNEWFYNKEIFPHFYKTLSLSEQQEQDELTHKNTKHYNTMLSNSVFTLCPEGGGINTIRIWEALAVGSIPVLIVSVAEIPMLLSIHPDLYKCCYIIYRHNIFTLFEKLKRLRLDTDKINKMSELCIHVYNDIRNRTTFENQYITSNTVFSCIL